MKRRLRRRRQPGSRLGLTRPQAEAELRRLLSAAATAPTLGDSLTFAEAAERYLHHGEHVRQRKRSTLQDYRIMVRRHLAPFLAGRRLDGVDRELLVAYMAAKRRERLAGRSIGHHLTLLNGIHDHAVRRGWTARNPVPSVDRPPRRTTDPDIRFLEPEELEALLRALPHDHLGPLERARCTWPPR